MNYNFTLNEENIYQVIVERINQKKEMTVSLVAEEAKVSPASVIKLAKKLGYSGFTEMHLSMSQKSKPKQTIKIESSQLEPIKMKDALELLKPLSPYFDRDSAACLIVIGLGICDSAASYLRKGLADIGINSHTNYAVSSHNSDDVAIFFSESGLVPYREAALLKGKGFKIISFTAAPTSPLANISDEIIEVPAQRSAIKSYKPNLFTANLYVLSAAIIQIAQGK